MRTRLLRAEDGEGAVREAAAILRRGGLVAFPTETVYGLGALGLDPRAVARVFAAKGRPRTDPVILHVESAAQAWELVREMPPAAEAAAAAFWPGPLTLVLPRSARVPDIVTAGLDSVAVRMPAHPLALDLIRRVGQPLAAPSANPFGRTSPTTAAHVMQDLSGRIDAVLDGGPAAVGVESTVVRLAADEAVLLRPGGVSREALERALGVTLRQREPAEREAASGAMESPGLLERHYSPRAELFLYEGGAGAAAAAIRKLAAEAPGATGALCYTEERALLAGTGVEIADLGSRERPEEAARRLYAALRELDARGVARIAARLGPAGGLGEALNDRLRRAASGRVLRPEAPSDAGDAAG